MVSLLKSNVWNNTSWSPAQNTTALYSYAICNGKVYSGFVHWLKAFFLKEEENNSRTHLMYILLSFIYKNDLALLFCSKLREGTLASCCDRTDFHDAPDVVNTDLYLWSSRLVITNFPTRKHERFLCVLALGWIIKMADVLEINSFRRLFYSKVLNTITKCYQNLQIPFLQ